MEILKSIVGGAAGAAFITGGFSLIKWFLERRAKKADREEEKNTADSKEREDGIAELRKDVDDLKVGLRMLMYDRIKHLAKSYIERGYITVEELEDLIDMHKVYHGPLHGNGFLDDLMDQVRHLEHRVK